AVTKEAANIIEDVSLIVNTFLDNATWAYFHFGYTILISEYFSVCWKRVLLVINLDLEH
ncbi:hypothetical protein P7K49_015945, partial [Saguinus oedipus]